MNSTAEIFFSYAWGDEEDTDGGREKIINDLYHSLKADGYNVVRDKNDMNYKSLISALTTRIGRGTIIVVAISDKYLKSPYCMCELLEIYRRSNSDIEEMLKKIFPIVLSDAKIYSPEDRVDYLKFWQSKKEALNERIKNVGLENAGTFTEDLRLYDEITSVIPILSKLLKDVNTLSPQKLSANNFDEIKKAIVKTLFVGSTSNHAVPITTPNRGPHFLKLPDRSILLAGLSVIILIASLSFFLRVSTTEIRLELMVSEVNFTLPQQPVLTSVLKLSSIGASGLKDVQLPFDSSIFSSSIIPSESSGTAILLSVDTTVKRFGTLALDPILLPVGLKIGLRRTDVDGEYRLSFEGKELTVPVQVNGFVKMALPPNTSEGLHFSSPGFINLNTEKDVFDLDLNLSPGSNTLFSGIIPADSLSLLRIDEHIDNETSVVRSVSTVLSGTLYLQSLRGEEQPLHPGEQVRFQTSRGTITKLELKSNHISFVYNGDVSGMTITTENKKISLMPTYFQWFKARLGVFFVPVIGLIVFLLSLGVKWLGFLKKGRIN